MQGKKGQLVLASGEFFVGGTFGDWSRIWNAENATADNGERGVGEVVFATGMTGYQEEITDPSFCGQILVMTYPLVGSYGINAEDDESRVPHLHGLVVRELQRYPSHWRSHGTLDEMLQRQGIPGLEGLDTRRLVRLIRKEGAVMGRFCSTDRDPIQVAAELRSLRPLWNSVAKVSCQQPYYVPSGGGPGRRSRIAVLDFGLKRNIIRALAARGCEVMVFPYDTPADNIATWAPDGILLSNGPGDPRQVENAIETIQTLLPDYPMLGICLGYQLLALACGADVTKMKFGHRGANHPVRDVRSGRVFITSQNHGYAVCPDSLRGLPLDVSHVSVNDGSLEGFCHQVFPVTGVQFHPEASPGPHDTAMILDQFLQQITEIAETGKETHYA